MVRNVEDRCPDCGNILSLDPSVAGLCPRCLVGLGLESSDDEEVATEVKRGVFPSEGQILGSRYQIRSLLGRGGMGEVWRAFDLKLQMDVALKALRSDFTSRKHAEEVLRREVRSARSVVSPNVCRIFDLVVEDGQELVSMEYIDGTTLAEILKSRGPLDLREAQEIASQFLAGLESIHEAGLVHLDFKPENVMVTRAGRVVVMDFGIAKGLAESSSGTVAGTPAYMAPERARGGAFDARTDVFSAGVVLAEMIAQDGERDRAVLWQALRESPPKVPDGPWAPVLRQALAWAPDARYESARSLARALNDATLKLAGFEEKHPYPGLASFTEEDAEYFFGRELEIETLWKKLKRPHLLALIGPSGTGKSSFLRAGILPTLPEGWTAAICTPGDRPFQALAQTLVTSFAGDADTMQLLLRFEDADVAVAVVSRWRQRYQQALIVIDQFEEIFTQNVPEVQRAFAALLSRLALEADAHVLLSMRDDFLFHCQDHEGLAPIFSELTPLGALSESSLRRALVQPALTCGYRFEDEALIDEMIEEVREERGALPLLAFAASRLWEKRDRENGLLTRRAYESIGRVGGALAYHAEATLDRIGASKLPILRELFRNLVTAQGTRAGRDVEELLSVFEEGEARNTAREVLQALVDARLLSSYESIEGVDGGGRRVELIHESLLTGWPRLVRWRAQDDEGAVLRDQLRQAAQLWRERERSQDLLWTGTAFRELELWRERYPGRLTETEEAFAEAMVARANRQRRRRRFVFAGIVGVLILGLTVVGSLWFRSEVARSRAEAARIVALGQNQLDRYPLAALAYARKSLEVADTEEARRLAVEALWRSPTARILPLGGEFAWRAAFSPDGHWLAAFPFSENVLVFPDDGGLRRAFGGHKVPGSPPWLAFTPDSNALLTLPRGALLEPRVRMLAVPSGRELRWLSPDLSDSELDSKPDSLAALDEGLLFVVRTGAPERGDRRLELVPYDGSPPRAVGSVQGDVDVWTDPDSEQIAVVRGERIFVRPLRGPVTTPQREVASFEQEQLDTIDISPRGDVLAVAEYTGRLTLWPLNSDGSSEPRVLTLATQDGFSSPAFAPQGDRIAWFSSAEKSAYLWDLDGPPNAEAVVLRRPDPSYYRGGVFHPSGAWLAVANHESITLWAVDQPRVRILSGHKQPMRQILFTEDSKSLVSCSMGQGARIWPLEPKLGVLRKIGPGSTCYGVAVDPTGEKVLVGVATGLALAPVEGGEGRMLLEFDDEQRQKHGHSIAAVAFDATGRRVAAGSRFSMAETPWQSVHEWDLEAGTSLEMSLIADGETGDDGYDWNANLLEFTPDGRLLVAGKRGIRRLDLDTSESEWVWKLEKEEEAVMSLSADGRHLLAAARRADTSERPAVLFDLERGTEWAISSHGNRVWSVALDSSGRTIVTGDREGAVRVSSIDGGEPHLLLGHSAPVDDVAVSPDGHWIASTAGVEIRLWPMPDLDKAPLHTLTRDELLSKLRDLTNLEVIEDEESPTGFSVVIGPFLGWAEMPTW